MLRAIDIIKYVLITIISYIYLYYKSGNGHVHDINNVKIVILFIALIIFFDILMSYNTKQSNKEKMSNTKEISKMDDEQNDVIDPEELEDDVEEENNIDFDEKSLSKLMQSNE